MAALKDEISPELVNALAAEMAAAWTPFPRVAFVAQATEGLERLELLARVSHLARALGDHLNDISRDHPALALSIAERWKGEGAEWVVRHGMRTLLKQGEPRAFGMLGFDPGAAVTLRDLRVTPDRVATGGAVEIAFTLATDGAVDAMVDYLVHHAGARGTRAPKVFKLTTCSLEPGAPRAITKRHAFRQVSVRRIHPGPHLVEIQVNGRVLGGVVVDVT